MLKIVIGTNEGKVLCISNNENKIKESMVNYLIDTDQEPTEDFYESRNWGEYDIEVYEYHQPQLNENQQIVLEWLKNKYTGNADPFGVAACLFSQTPRSEVIVATLKLTRDEQAQVLKIFANWTLEQEEE